MGCIHVCYRIFPSLAPALRAHRKKIYYFTLPHFQESREAPSLATPFVLQVEDWVCVRTRALRVSVCLICLVEVPCVAHLRWNGDVLIPSCQSIPLRWEPPEAFAGGNERTVGL